MKHDNKTKILLGCLNSINKIINICEMDKYQIDNNQFIEKEEIAVSEMNDNVNIEKEEIAVSEMNDNVNILEDVTKLFVKNNEKINLKNEKEREINIKKSLELVFYEKLDTEIKKVKIKMNMIYNIIKQNDTIVNDKFDNFNKKINLKIETEKDRSIKSNKTILLLLQKINNQETSVSLLANNDTELNVKTHKLLLNILDEQQKTINGLDEGNIRNIKTLKMLSTMIQ
jgi:hypothetical protein